MDKFKEYTINDYTSWDINCPKVVKRTVTMKKLRNIFKRKARRKLKQELKNERYD